MTFKQIQDGGRTPYWKSFLAISRRYIGRSMRNLDWRWRITCRYRPHDKNGNFQNFKMADGRHFENSFVSISQPWIIRFLSNLVWRCECPFRRLKFAKKSKFCKFKMADGRHIEIVLAVFWRHIGWLMRNLEQRWRITCRYRSHDQNENNFRKFISQPWIIRFRSDFRYAVSMNRWKQQILYRKNCPQSIRICISRCSKMAKIKRL